MQLVSTINLLLKPQTPMHLEATEERCNSYIAFFKKKIDTICFLLSSSITLPVTSSTTIPVRIELQLQTVQPLCCFYPILQQEVKTSSRK